MSETPDLESTADRVVAALHNIDGKVNAKRDQRLSDPDSFGDKIFKFAMPTLVGLAFGKVFEMAWKKSVGRKATLPDGTTDARKDAILGIAFAVISAALGGSRNCPTAVPRPSSTIATPSAGSTIITDRPTCPPGR